MFATTIAVVAAKAGPYERFAEEYCRDTAPDAEPPSNSRLLIGIVYGGVGAKPEQRPSQAWALTADAITPIDPSTLVCGIVTGD